MRTGSLPPDLPFRRVVPAWEGNGIVVWFERRHGDDSIDQRGLLLLSRHQDPQRAADDLATQLLAVPPRLWGRTFRPGH